MRKPICDVCNKSVDEFVSTEDFCRDRKLYAAICHGEKEIVELDRIDLLEADNIELGRAFTTKRLSI